MSVSHRVTMHEDYPGDVEVWLDTEADDRDGICLGTGDTSIAALLDAKEELEAALVVVNRHLTTLEPACR